MLGAGDVEEAARADRLTQIWPGVCFAIGVHPHQAGDFDGRVSVAAALVESTHAARAAARAIGEIGLDYHYEFAPRSTQRDVFAAQLALARTMGRPVVIHTREAEADTIDMLRSEGGGEVRGVLHCFTGSKTLAQQALDLDFYISFAGILTFPKAANLREIARMVPADRLLVETDSPYLAPVPYRGKRNEPAWVARTIEALAELRGSHAADIDRQTTANFHALFRA